MTLMDLTSARSFLPVFLGFRGRENLGGNVPIKGTSRRKERGRSEVQEWGMRAMEIYEIFHL